jgi:uncharacterized membrane protein
MEASYGLVPTSTESSDESALTKARTVGTVAAVIAHAGAFFGWFLVPLCVWLLQRKRNRFGEFHALQAMLWSLAGTLVTGATCGLALPVFLGFHLWAAVKVLREEDYEYPIIGDFARTLMG